MNINISTGNSIVDAVGRMNLTGNIIPEAWYKTIAHEDGKPYLNAIILLAEIVYWYRPTEVRDEATNTVLYRKKFKSDDFLQKSYRQITDKFGLSKKQAQDALRVLEGIVVIHRIPRNVETSDGVIFNSLFIELYPDVLYQITFPKDDNNVVTKNAASGYKKITPEQKRNQVTTKYEKTSYKKSTTNTNTITDTITDTTTEAVADDIKQLNFIINKNQLHLSEQEVNALYNASGQNLTTCQNVIMLAANTVV